MRQSTEQRLESLQAKRQALDAQIKRIEKEKARELRQRQTRREQLVGRAIYALVRSGDWTEAQLTELMDPVLKRAGDRRLFGLPVSRSEVGVKVEEKVPEKTGESVAASAAVSTDEGAGQAKEKRRVKPKSVQPLNARAVKQEFNL